MDLFHPLKAGERFFTLFHYFFWYQNKRTSFHLLSHILRPLVGPKQTLHLTFYAVVNFIQTNSFYFLKEKKNQQKAHTIKTHNKIEQNKKLSELFKPYKSIPNHSVLFVLGLEESLPPSWVHTAIYFMRTFYTREKKRDVERVDNHVNSEVALFRKELRVPFSIISTVSKLLTGLLCCSI